MSGPEFAMDGGQADEPPPSPKPARYSTEPPPLGLFPFFGGVETVQTEMANKFGIALGLMHLNAIVGVFEPGVLKSFFTPVPKPGPHASPEEQYRSHFIEEIQKSRMKGFSARTLFEHEVFTYRLLNAPTSRCPIHPMLARERWKGIEPGAVLFPISDPTGFIGMDNIRPSLGTWHGNDDVAWNALLPSIMLASTILSVIHEHPWFDALLLGKEDPLEHDRFPVEPVLARQDHPHFHRNLKARKPLPENLLECLGARKELEEWPALKNMTWGFTSVSARHDGVKHENDGLVAGYTSWNPTTNSIAMYLGYEKVALLLRYDLSDTERLGLQLMIANTMVHECVHAYGMAKRQREQVRAGLQDTYPFMSEPYFLDEVCSELGASMEGALWGGSMQELTEKRFSVPLGHGIMRPPQPELTAFPILTKPALPKLDFFRPIQAEFYEAVHQANFWEFRFGKFRDVRPGQLRRNGQLSDLYTTKPKGQNGGPWTPMTNLHEYEQALKPSGLSEVVMNGLLKMTPADRHTFQQRKQRREAYHKVVKLLAERRSKVGALWDLAEILSRVDITTGDPHIAAGLQDLMTLLENMIDKSYEVMVELFSLDPDGPYLTCLLESQLFARGLRNMLEVMSGTRDNALNNRLAAASDSIMNLWIALTVGPSRPFGIEYASERRMAAEDEEYFKKLTLNALYAYESNRKQEALDTCDELINHVGPSLLTKCWARVLVAYNSEVELELRVAMAERAVTTLQATTAPPGREEEQVQALQLGINIKGRLAIESQAADNVMEYV